MRTRDCHPRKLRRGANRSDSFIEDMSWKDRSEIAYPLHLLPPAFLDHFRAVMRPSGERTPTALFYCRVSNPRSNGDSLEVQLENCRRHMQELGAVPASADSVFIDHGLTGTKTENRGGFANLLAEVEARRPDYVICSTACRIARNLGDFAHFWDLLDFYRTELHEAGTGIVRSSDVPVIGFQADQERRRFIQCAIEGTWLAAAGGDLLGKARTFGYDLAEDGPFRLVRNKIQAPIVLRIFQEFDRYPEFRPLCRRLNDDNIPTKYGKRWTKPVLVGPGTHCGVLNNLLYRGTYVFGRAAETRPPAWLELPMTTDGRPLPICFDVPELALVPVSLFDSVQVKLGELKRAAAVRRIGWRRKATLPNLLTGLVRCGCGAAMCYKPGRNLTESLVCVGSLSGTSDHPAYVPSADVEREVLRIVDDNSPAEEADAPSAFRNHPGRRGAEVKSAALRRRIRTVEQRLEDSLDVSLDGPAARGIEARRSRWERELVALEGELETVSARDRAGSKDRGSKAPRSIRAVIAPMFERIPFKAGGEDEMQSREAVRSRLSRIVVTSKGHGEGFDLAVELTSATVDQAISVLRIERSACRRKLGFAAEEGLLPRLEKVAEAGILTLDDDTWNAVSPLFARLNNRKFDCRIAADAAIFVALMGVPLTMAPPCFGTRNQLSMRFRVIGRLGIWRSMVERLRRRGHPRAQDLDPGHHEPAPQGTRSTRGRSGIRKAYHLLQELEREMRASRGGTPTDSHSPAAPVRSRRRIGSSTAKACRTRKPCSSEVETAGASGSRNSNGRKRG